MTWFALLATSGQEPKAVAYLAKRKYEPYWPSYRTRTKWRHHKGREILRSALPGYMFLQAFRPDWRQVLETPGIREVMRDAERKPLELSEGDMAKVRNIDAGINSSPINAARGIPFRVGQHVRLIHSIWENWETPILAIDKSGRLVIEIPILGGRRVARIAAAEVEAL